MDGEIKHRDSKLAFDVKSRCDAADGQQKKTSAPTADKTMDCECYQYLRRSVTEHGTTRRFFRLSDDDKLSPDAIYLIPHALATAACVYKICMHNDMTPRIVMGTAKHGQVPRICSTPRRILTGAITRHDNSLRNRRSGLLCTAAPYSLPLS